MAEHKTSCPKCDGHIVFPKELARQAIACPHCNETFFLPNSKSATLWIIAAVFGLIAICLGSLLILQRHHGISDPQTHSFAAPLGFGQYKTGFIRCGTGYTGSRVPVKVAVYLESGERRNLVYKGLLIQ